MAYANKLDQAIEGLYVAFEGYRLPKHTNPCPCCHTAEDELILHAQPLRELDPDHLWQYSGDALMTWGDEAVFKHFLPRMFELLATLPECPPRLVNREIVFSKFRHGNWRAWPEEEQAAVERYLHSVWHEVLGVPPAEESYSDLESWICSIGQCEDDLSSYLHEWVEDERQSASFALCWLLLTSAVARTGRNGRNEFWRGRDDQYAQLQKWVKSPAVIEKLTNAEVRCTDSTLADEFAAARSICS
jgi:hypothetical protein